MWAATTIVALAAAHTYLAWRRLLAYLRYFQQEGYEPWRFLKWTRVRSLTDPAFWLSIVCAWLSGRWLLMAAALFVGGALGLAWGQPDPRRSGKVPLKLTWRARRILVAALLLASGLWLLVVEGYRERGLGAAFVASSVVLAAMPFVLMYILYIMEPEMISLMWTTFLGWVFLLMMMTLQFVGAWMIKKIVTIDV